MIPAKRSAKRTVRCMVQIDCSRSNHEGPGSMGGDKEACPGSLSALLASELSNDTNTESPRIGKRFFAVAVWGPSNCSIVCAPAQYPLSFISAGKKSDLYYPRSSLRPSPQSSHLFDTRPDGSCLHSAVHAIRPISHPMVRRLGLRYTTPLMFGVAGRKEQFGGTC